MNKKKLKNVATLCGMTAIILGGGALMWAGTHIEPSPPNTVPPLATPGAGATGAELSEIRIQPIVPDSTQTTGKAGSGGADTGSSVTVTTGEDGTVTIDRVWGSKPDGAVTVLNPDQPVTNMQGGGGQMDVDKDDVYHGDVPPAQKQPQAPATTPEQTTPKDEPKQEKPAEQEPPKTDPPPKEEQPPKTDTPPKVEDPPKTDPPPKTEDPPKEEKPSGSGGAQQEKPTHPGYDGDKVGNWEWWDGFGWVEMGKGNGGTGGDDSDMVTGGLSGNKVGTM